MVEDRRSRIYVSPPDVGVAEKSSLLNAFESQWIAPVGPYLDRFEADLASYLGATNVVALSSGTAGLHLALIALGVGSSDEVFVPTLTFAATANAVIYVGGRPCFLDSETASWNLDPALLEDQLIVRARRNKLPKAVIAVDLYGQCADYERIEKLCSEYEVPLVEDAAEALGATYEERSASTFGAVGVLSFNGNKIITTSGGGAAVTSNEGIATRIRHLATQAREPVEHYEHREVGFNYRLSNLLAALGVAQLNRLNELLEKRRIVNQIYREELAGLPGIGFQPQNHGTPNFWLTVMTIDTSLSLTDAETIRKALAREDIEARPAWKPLHLQTAYRSYEAIQGSVAESIFKRGLCLPSSSTLSLTDQMRVIQVIRQAIDDRR